MIKNRDNFYEVEKCKSHLRRLGVPDGDYFFNNLGVNIVEHNKVHDAIPLYGFMSSIHVIYFIVILWCEYPVVFPQLSTSTLKKENKNTFI